TSEPRWPASRSPSPAARSGTSPRIAWDLLASRVSPPAMATSSPRMLPTTPGGEPSTSTDAPRTVCTAPASSTTPSAPSRFGCKHRTDDALLDPRQLPGGPSIEEVARHHRHQTAGQRAVPGKADHPLAALDALYEARHRPVGGLQKGHVVTAVVL